MSQNIREFLRRNIREYLRDETGAEWAVFLIALPFGVIGVYLPLYGRELGASAFQVGALFTAFGLVGVFARPLVGLAADRLGRRPFILAGALAYALSAILCAASFTLPLLFASRIAAGVGSALFWVGTRALLADLGRDGSRARLFGRLVTASTTGASAGTVAGAGAVFLLGIVLGWRVVFVGFGLAGALALALLYRRVPTGMPPKAAPVARRSSPAGLVFLLGVAFVVAAAYAMLVPIVLLYFKDRLGYSEFLLGVVFAPSAVVYALAPARLGGLGDRYSRRVLIAGALLGSAVSSLFSSFAPALLVLGAVWLMEALLVSAAVPAQEAVVSELSGGDVRGRAYGFYAAATGLGGALGPLAGGWLYDNAGLASPFWVNAAVLSLSAGLVLWKLPEARPAGRTATVRVEADSPA